MARDTAQHGTQVVRAMVEGAAVLIGRTAKTDLNGMSECVN